MTRVHGDGERDGSCLLCSVVLSAEGLARKNMSDWWKHWKWPPSLSASDNILCLNKMQ